MVSTEKILDTAATLQVDIVGLSGLITPSLDEMAYVAKEMQRRKLTLPLLIGGATTSAKHTAVRIAPQYEQPTLHVLDASRCVGVVDKLLSPSLRPELLKQNTSLQKQLAESYRQRDVKLAPLAEARARRFQTDWTTVDIPRPAFTGLKVLREYPLTEIAKF